VNAESQAHPLRASPVPFSASTLLVLAGPTAVGKSQVALRLATLLDGEIVSVDSMQVYRGLDIGTAKPSPADRARVPHHLVDVLDLNAGFDAARFVDLARQAVDEIRARRHVPILCGGTGFYFKALLEGLGTAPPASPQLRQELVATPLPELLRELQQGDPDAHEKIDRLNPRRVIRAVEVLRLTGKPFSQQRANRSSASISGPTFRFGLRRSSSELHRRIDLRVDEMFARGLVSETRQLLERGLRENPTALQALGYRQVIEHLEGKRSLPETIELVKIRTRQYARRQMTWFRRQLQLEWIEMEGDDVGRTVEQIVGLLNRG
jgi:tRNA dimethylallyltransferase